MNMEYFNFFRSKVIIKLKSGDEIMVWERDNGEVISFGKSIYEKLIIHENKQQWAEEFFNDMEDAFTLYYLLRTDNEVLPRIVFSDGEFKDEMFRVAKEREII